MIALSQGGPLLSWRACIKLFFTQTHISTLESAPLCSTKNDAALKKDTSQKIEVSKKFMMKIL